MKILQHLSAMLIVTIIIGVIYASVQHTWRANANDPQTALLYTMRDRIQQGKPIDFVFSDSVDLGSSLSPFLVTYNGNGDPLRSNGFIDQNLPRLPKGVLDFARTHGEHWVTWQPRTGIRMAMGILNVQAGAVQFIAAGRSLAQVEQRVSRLEKILLAGWLACICIILVNAATQVYVHRRTLIKNKFSL